MSNLAVSPRIHSARLAAMAVEAREEGKSGVADLLMEVARRAAEVEAMQPKDEQREAV